MNSTLDVNGTANVKNIIYSESGSEWGTKYKKQSIFFFGHNDSGNTDGTRIKFYKLFKITEITSFSMKARLSGTWINDANFHEIVISFRLS